MPQKKAVTPWEKEFARLERRRRAYQARHARPPESRLDRALEEAGHIDMFIHLGDVEGGEDYINAVISCEKHR